MKRINTGTSDFQDLIESESIYVDKTAYMHRLISDKMNKVLFISRPHRFGKSLTISALICTLPLQFAMSSTSRFDSTADTSAPHPSPTLSALALAAQSAGASGASRVVVAVDPADAVGPVKPMNAVNNGPSVKNPGGDQVRGNFDEYKAARIPFARTHDSINCVSGGARTCDISAVFPDFDADENDPRNYDFVFTDHYLDNIRRADTRSVFPDILPDILPCVLPLPIL